MIAETNRLILREFEVTDAKHLFRLNSDFDVIKYTGDKPFGSINDAEVLLNNYSQYRNYGYGRWAVIVKETGNFIGWCGLKYLEEINETDLGYRFFKDQWGKGYATESSIKALELAFQKFQIPNVVGKVMKENEASIRVLKKVGMQYWKDFDFDGHPGEYYRIEMGKIPGYWATM